MISTTPFKLSALLASALLAACATTNAPPNNPPAPTPTPAPVASKPVAASAPATSSAAPSVLIRGRSSKAILDDVVNYRTQQKGMKLKSRSGSRVELSLAMQRTSNPSEARMVYQLTPENGAQRLSARVFQYTHPGTTRETGVEITQSLQEQLLAELPRYQQQAASR
ncbi:hypothetical protein [Chitinilyticum litopenaei]|uniref:hypothetical protein n=1 Tax=Chitinilyticum litopenaei TaxID=1121276 RepID=UPI0004162B45|nr:hypothetical protein [Chitinilyticum litopenaei]